MRRGVRQVCFVKQRTAYELRSSDWSSDVCSSDLYGTDAIAETDGAERAGGYNPVRGAKVIAFARQFLDDSIALAQGSHTEATAYAEIGRAWCRESVCQCV